MTAGDWKSSGLWWRSGPRRTMILGKFWGWQHWNTRKNRHSDDWIVFVAMADDCLMVKRWVGYSDVGTSMASIKHEARSFCDFTYWYEQNNQTSERFSAVVYHAQYQTCLSAILPDESFKRYTITSSPRMHTEKPRCTTASWRTGAKIASLESRFWFSLR